MSLSFPLSVMSHMVTIQEDNYDYQPYSHHQ